MRTVSSNRERVTMHTLLPATVLLCLAASQVGATPIDIFVMAGQSNAQGGGHVDDLPHGFPLEQPDVLYAHDTGALDVEPEGWGPLQPRLTSNGTHRRWYGTELTFGRTLVDAGLTVGLIKFARGGTSLKDDWAPGGVVRQAFYQFADESLAQLSLLGYEPTVRGMVWVQGESDSGSYRESQLYEERLEGFAEEFRARYGGDALWELNLLHQDVARPDMNIQIVREGQARFASEDGMAAAISIDDLTLSSDRVHFTSQMQQVLGARFAAAYLERQGWTNQVPEPAAFALVAQCALLLFLARRSARTA